MLEVAGDDFLTVGFLWFRATVDAVIDGQPFLDYFLK